MGFHKAYDGDDWFDPDTDAGMMVVEIPSGFLVREAMAQADDEDGTVTSVRQYFLTMGPNGNVVAMDMMQSLIMRPSCGHAECAMLRLEFPLN